jgi:hypothetical protein
MVWAPCWFAFLLAVNGTCAGVWCTPTNPGPYQCPSPCALHGGYRACYCQWCLSCVLATKAACPSCPVVDVWLQAAAGAWLGPDDLSVYLEGPEHLNVPGVHVGGCEYRFLLRVTIPGQYRLVVWAERTDYDSLRGPNLGDRAQGACWTVCWLTLYVGPARCGTC